MLYIFLLYLLLILHQFVLKLISQLSNLCPGFMYLMLQQTGSKVGLELRAYTQVISSLRGCSCSPVKAGGSYLGPACVASHLVVMEDGSHLWLRVRKTLKNTCLFE